MSLLSFPRVKAVISSEATGTRSRENITVTLSGSAIPSGTILGKLSSGKYVPYNNAGSGGAEIAAGILYSYLPAKTGDSRAVAFVRSCEAHRDQLVGLDAAGEADLLLTGVVVRDVSGLPGIATPAL